MKEGGYPVLEIGPIKILDLNAPRSAMGAHALEEKDRQRGVGE